MNVRQLLGNLQSEPGRIIALDQTQSITAAALLNGAAKYYARLPASAGRWALYFDNSVECAAAVLAVWLRGGQPCLAPNNLPATCAALRPQVDGFIGEFHSIDTLHQADQPAADWNTDSLANEPGIAFFTSGSSGEPQCIEKHAAQLFNEVATLESTFGDAMGDALVVSSVSHQHIYGFLFRLLWPLVSGRPFATDNLTYSEAISTYAAPRMVWVSSPTHLTRLPPTLIEPRVAVIFSSGAPLPGDASQAAAVAFDADVIEVFGSTETGGIGWRCQHRGEQHWRLFPGLTIETDDEDILSLRSPHLPNDQWHTCADRIRLEAQGFLLLGRADRIVKVEGKRVSLEQLEALLMACAEIDDVRIEPIRRRGRVAERDELMVLAVLSSSGMRARDAQRKVLIAQLKSKLGEMLERPLLPRRWRFVERLPRNSQGKLEKNQLQQLVDELLVEKRCG